MRKGCEQRVGLTLARRDFVALSALSFTAAISSRAMAGTRTGRGIGSAQGLALAIADPGCAHGRQFLDAARIHGVAVAPASHTMTGLWRDNLAPLWRNGTGAVIGLTAPEALFQIERLAWDAGQRVVWRGDHDRTGAGRWQHAVTTSGQPLAAPWPDDDTWPQSAFARMALAAPRGRQSHGRGYHSDPRGSAWLTSWIIAPASRGA